MTLSNNSKQRSNLLISLVIVIAIIATIVGVWVIKNQTVSNGQTRQITYHVEASGGYALIVYTNSTGVNTKAEMLTTPFNKSITIPIGKQVYLTASNPSQTGTISCKIRIDNRDWKQSKATHPVDSVACGGIVR